MKKLLIFLCLALCIVLACSCGGNDTDTNTDTGSDTQASQDTSSDTNTNSDVNTDTDTNTDVDTGVDLNDGKYRVFVCDNDGNAIEGVWVQFCEEKTCNFLATDANGYVEIPGAEYHIAGVTDENGVYKNIVYSEAEYLHFEQGSKLITITLEKK